MIIRDAEIAEIGQLAKIWHEGCQDERASGAFGPAMKSSSLLGLIALAAMF
jgi:hypothetical protein